ncbi:MAG: beta-galactosidase trimerization domain-containing protein, partial [Lentisphaeria bacterium]|nr:beta-galactosidase trimerization domain-containing protein [Lentisphaeria bacterium]
FFGQMEEAPYLMAAANAWCRSAGKDPKTGFWAVEGEAGQINYFQDRKDRGERGWRIASNWQLAANGARMLMFWKFGGRVTDTQTDQFNLTALDGSITERAELLSGSCNAFLRLKDFIADSCVHAETAILFAPDTELARICDKTYKEYVDACHGAFRILNELHIECDYVNERLFREKRGRYKVIIAPETIFLNRKFAEELKQFISGGGTLITDYRFAQKREDSFQFQTLPGYDLQEAAGIFVNDFTYAERDEVFPLEGYPAVPLKDLFRAKLQLEDAESLADYIHGGCALSVHPFGKGKYVCWGFSPFSVFRTAKSTEQLGGIREMFRRFCADAGVVSDFKITGDDKHQLQTGTLCRDDAPAGEKTCFLINFADEPLECKAELPGREQETTELLTGKLFPGKTLSLKFAPFETMIFSCR